jgi:hypothetical protein
MWIVAVVVTLTAAATLFAVQRSRSSPALTPVQRRSRRAEPRL